jgi:hypothetical protein
MRVVETLDPLIARMLFVTPQPGEQATPDIRTAERAFSVALVFSGIRCILQYLVLPIALPLIGLTRDFSLGVVAPLNLIALGLLMYNLRRLWQTRHPSRWNMLPLSLGIALVIIVFLAYDIRAVIE